MSKNKKKTNRSGDVKQAIRKTFLSEEDGYEAIQLGFGEIKEKKLHEKLIELGYMKNIYEDTLWNKKYNDYCIFHIELETDEEYKKERLIHTAYIESVFIIHEQRIIDELEKGLKILFKELRYLDE